MREIDNDTESLAFANKVAPKRGQAVRRRASRGKDAAASGAIAPGMGKTDDANAQLIKNAEQIQVGPDWFDPFHCNQQRNLPLLPRAFDVRIRFANGEAIGPIAFEIKPGNLIEPNCQSAVR